MRSVQRESELERSVDVADNRQWTRRKSERRCSHVADKLLIYRITKFISPVCCNRRSRARLLTASAWRGSRDSPRFTLLLGEKRCSKLTRANDDKQPSDDRSATE